MRICFCSRWDGKIPDDFQLDVLLKFAWTFMVAAVTVKKMRQKRRRHFSEFIRLLRQGLVSYHTIPDRPSDCLSCLVAQIHHVIMWIHWLMALCIRLSVSDLGYNVDRIHVLRIVKANRCVVPNDVETFFPLPNIEPVDGVSSRFRCKGIYTNTL